jgi:hypothetical protein
MFMDKQLLKAYIRTIVEEEVKRVLPEMLSEAVQQVKQLSESNTSQPTKSAKPAFDRKRLAELIGYDGDTLVANTGAVPLPENTPRDVPPEIINAVTKDYSQMMKKMGLT